VFHPDEMERHLRIQLCRKGGLNMLHQIFTGVFFLALLLAAAAPTSAQRIQNRGQGRGINQYETQILCPAAINSLPKQTLDSTEAAGIIYMREEEKLAHDVYTALVAEWGMRIFGNISQSEERHFTVLKLLLDRYGLPDPAADKPIGIFQNAGLQELYDSLVAEGRGSLQNAFRVGVTIEEIDIRDLEKAASATDNSDLKMVYQNLTLASEQHLRTFVSQLSAAGGNYIPEHISPARFSEILANPQEPGRGNGARGSGRGVGRGNNGNCPRMSF
jgi:hypothetical protein